MRPAFYDSLQYKQNQASKTKIQWETGVFNSRIKSLEKRSCSNANCLNQFEVKPYDPKKYCSRSCAITVNNTFKPKKRFLKEELESLYISGHSMNDMAKKLNCSIHKITYWMDKFSIKKRSMSDAIYLKSNPNGDPFKIPQVIPTHLLSLHALGLGVYWGEGDKTSPHCVRICNTDPKMLIIFRRFLIEVCNLDPKKIHYSIICFNEADPKAASKYWSQALKIFPNKFGKIVQIPPQGPGTYTKKSSFGVCTISANNIKLKAWVLEEIDKLASRRSSMVEQAHGKGQK